MKARHAAVADYGLCGPCEMPGGNSRHQRSAWWAGALGTGTLATFRVQYPDGTPGRIAQR
jgi:hypothetical protein